MDDNNFDLNILAKYNDYLLTIKDINKNAGRKTLPLLIVGLIITVLGITSFFWLGYRTASYCLWIGIIAPWIFFIITIISQSNFKKSEIARISHQKKGFDQFFETNKRHPWPKELHHSDRYQEFLSIISE